VGRFASTVEFYRYREPYPPEFFPEVARRLELTKHTRLLDVGCGPGNLVIGFAPLVGTCTAIDVEPEMLDTARKNAARVNVSVTFLQTPIQDLHAGPNSFDLITVGRALHWLPREETLAVFGRILALGGHIAVCGCSGPEDRNAWTAEYRRVRDAWTSEDLSRYKMDFEKWFEGSRFAKSAQIEVPYTHRVPVADLVNRAISFSPTSPDVLGERRSAYQAEIGSALAPFAHAGHVDEHLVAKATVFS